jgi:hypothetical protein
LVKVAGSATAVGNSPNDRETGRSLQAVDNIPLRGRGRRSTRTDRDIPPPQTDNTSGCSAKGNCVSA